MRKPAEWMTKADNVILEFIDEDGRSQPSHIAHRLPEIGEDLDFHRHYIGKRCRKLAEAGLLLNVGNGVYAITDQGGEYLRGDLDAATLEEPDTE